MNLIGLTQKRINNVETLMSLIEFGMSIRTSGTTSHNDESSRSHGILQISLRLPSNKIFSKISFIDLAGSERAADVQDQSQ